MKCTWFVFVLLFAVALSGCAKDAVVVRDTVNYDDYSPGYTGYTQGYDGYGNYNDGYGPSFWNARYYFYSGYNHGY